MPAAKKKPGLYANIHAKQERVAHGSGEKMRQPGSAGAPTEASFDAAKKTEKAPGKAPGKKPGKSAPAKKAAR